MALSFGSSIVGGDEFLSIGYRTHASGQSEVEGIVSHSSNNVYETLYTVTTGKVLYISEIFLTNGDGGARTCFFARGAAASEVDFLIITAIDGQTDVYSLRVPIRVTSGTRISVKVNPVGNDSVILSLTGFEE